MSTLEDGINEALDTVVEMAGTVGRVASVNVVENAV